MYRNCNVQSNIAHCVSDKVILRVVVEKYEAAGRVREGFCTLIVCMVFPLVIHKGEKLTLTSAL